MRVLLEFLLFDFGGLELGLAWRRRTRQPTAQSTSLTHSTHIHPTTHSNHRPTWNASVDEPVAGNYYPVNAAAFLHDARAQLAVIVDRSQVGR